MFLNRKDAAEQLAKLLGRYRNNNPLVVGIARGGVETAYYVACDLQAELSLVVTRKLGYPQNPEAAFGALAEDGSYFIFEEAKARLPPEVISNVVAKEEIEIARRVKALRDGKPLPDIEGRTVIIVDDGIATGATLFATIKLCKNQGADKIVVAVPVSGKSLLPILQPLVDDVVILSTPGHYFAVSQVYQSFSNLTDREVVDFLNKSHRSC